MSDEAEVPYGALGLKAGRLFIPTAPINKQQLFAGRIDQLRSLLDMIYAEGQHAVVYGERGVGKTSLVSVAQSAMQATDIRSHRENCLSSDTFATLWRRAFEGIEYDIAQRGAGFGAQDSSRRSSLAQYLPEVPEPHHVVSVLRRLEETVVFMFDEFDQITNRELSKAFADTIKALSDHSSLGKVVLVGVGDNIDELVTSHASIARAIIQIRMPRMQLHELAEIISKGSSELGMKWDEAAVRRVVRLSQGLPTYVHRLALYATREALDAKSLVVTTDNVKFGMRKSVESASQSLTEAYLKATSSQRDDALFGPVLLACALAKTDELGYFRPRSLKRPLEIIGHKLDVPAFSSHLNKFATEDRGLILQKTGSDRQWRYRFRDPLIQPFVIMRGVTAGDVTMADVDRALAEPALLV